MNRPAAALPISDPSPSPHRPAGALRWTALAACAGLLAGCAAQPTLVDPGKPGGGRHFDPVLGVWASPRLVDDGQPVPRGGGGFLVGRPYTIGGRTYVPNASPQGYTAAGTASWYGDAFHGRRTANGEIFDKGSVSAAHPTLPLPSYVRVTNLKNGRSMVVRVNDRGPYHGGRVMDVSQRVAEALAFRDEGTGHVRIDYLGRAELAGSDDARLLATLTTDGRPARLDGLTIPADGADGALPPRPDGPSPFPNLPARVASLPLFRRGHALPVADAPPLDGLSAPSGVPARPAVIPLRAAPARALAAPAVRAEPAAPRAPARRGRPGPDPFYRPLFPPAPQPRPAISFADPDRRAASRRRPDSTAEEAPR